MKVCVIGVGKMGQVHVDNIVQHPVAQLHSVVDPDLGAAQEIAQRHGVVALKDAEEALQSSDIDVVVIASRSDTHAPIIKSAAQKGKAIFCEKPIALSMEEVAECTKCISEAEVPFMLGFNRRFDPRFAWVHEGLQAGKVGSVEMVSVTSRDALPPPIAYLKASGGIFRDMTIHDFDMARWMLGEEPIEVFAAGSCLVNEDFTACDDADTAMVILKTASGRLCQINNSRRSSVGYDQRVEVFGERGVLRSEDATIGATPVLRKPRPGDHFSHIFNRYQQSYRAELDHFLHCVQCGTRPLIGVDDGLRALKIANAAQESKEKGVPVCVGCSG